MTLEPITLSELEERRTAPKLILLGILLIGIAAAVFISLVHHYNQPPTEFISPTTFKIEPGTGIKSITSELEAAGVVRSSTLLYFIIVLFFEPTQIKASTYFFDKPLSTYETATRLVSGDFSSDLVKFTHFEGERSTSISRRASEVLVNFNEAEFLARAVPLEGKLYPDTYFIPASFTADELIDLMLKTYDSVLLSLEPLIKNHPLTTEQIIALASIIEREANSPESMKMVSGILQNRLEIDMPLQADASIEYILDKPLGQLVPEDLEIDSPYNTYLNRGLPPTPIGNPGINSIRAVLEPTKTDYFYYITDAEGVFHFAVTYDEHRKNIAQYLR